MGDYTAESTVIHRSDREQHSWGRHRFGHLYKCMIECIYTYQNRESIKEVQHINNFLTQKVKMAKSHQSSPNSDFESYTKCHFPEKISTGKPDPGEVKKLDNDSNKTVSQLTLKRQRGIKHNKKKKEKKKAEIRK